MLSTFLNIICYSIGSLLWGVVTGAICMALFFLLIKGWWKDAVMSLSTYIVGGILGILLMFQCTLICGSLAIMRKANQFEALATEAIEQMVTSGKATLNEIVDQAETQEVMNEIVRNHPILGNYCKGADFSGHSLVELPKAMTAELNNYLTKYIIRRLLWALAFVVVAAIIANYTISKGNGTSRRREIGRRGQDCSRQRDRSISRPNMRRNRYRQ